MKYALLFTLAMAAFIASPIHADDIESLTQKYFDLARTGKDDAEAKKVGEGILAQGVKDKDANNLNEFAWKLLTEDGIPHRDLDLGMKAAKAALDACEGKEAAIVDTYAHALYDTGKVSEAIEFQKKAVELCNDDNLKSDLQDTLKKYQEKANEKK